MMKKLTIRASALAVAAMLLLMSLFAVFAEVTNTYAITDDAAVFNADETAEILKK